MSSQQRHPWRAVLRTVVEAVVPLIIIFPLIVPIVNEELGAYLPEGWQAAAVAVATFITAVMAAIARILAIPQVDEWLSRWLPWLASEPKPVEVEPDGAEYEPKRAA